MSTPCQKSPLRGFVLAALGAALGLAGLFWATAAHAEVAKTATTVQCTPDSVKAGEQSDCTAMVKGVAGKDAGQVVFKSEAGGAFSPTPCKLAFGELGLASCTVEYTAPAGASSDRVHAIFLGNEASAPSEGTFRVTILGGGEGEGGEGEGKEVPPPPNPTATALSCTPGSANVGEAVHCTATVSGVVGSTSGQVLFKSENGGTFAASSCKLSFAKGTASCGVDYTSAATATGADRLHAIYAGDAANTASEGLFTLAIVGKGGGGKEEGGGKEGGGKEVKGQVVRVAPARASKARFHQRRHHRSRSHHRARSH